VGATGSDNEVRRRHCSPLLQTLTDLEGGAEAMGSSTSGRRHHQRLHRVILALGGSPEGPRYELFTVLPTRSTPSRSGKSITFILKKSLQRQRGPASPQWHLAALAGWRRTYLRVRFGRNFFDSLSKSIRVLNID
jgi:hypothetical protein